MLFDTNKIFRIHYSVPAFPRTTSKSLKNQELALSFIRRVLDESGTIEGIKYNGQVIPPADYEWLMQRAKQLTLTESESKLSLGRTSRTRLADTLV